MIAIDVSESMAKKYNEQRTRISLAVQAATMMIQQKVGLIFIIIAPVPQNA